MNDYRDEIDRIIKDGVRKDLDTKVIVDQILRLMTEVRKKDHISVEEFEELVRQGKQRIQDARRLLLKSLTG